MQNRPGGGWRPLGRRPGLIRAAGVSARREPPPAPRPAAAPVFPPPPRRAGLRQAAPRAGPGARRSASARRMRSTSFRVSSLPTCPKSSPRSALARRSAACAALPAFSTAADAAFSAACAVCVASSFKPAACSAEASPNCGPEAGLVFRRFELDRAAVVRRGHGDAGMDRRHDRPLLGAIEPVAQRRKALMQFRPRRRAGRPAMSEPRPTPAPRCAAGAHVHPPVPPARCWLGDGGGFGGSGRTLLWHSVADRLVSPSRATTRRGAGQGATGGPCWAAAEAGTTGGEWREGKPDAVWRCWACTAPEGGLDTKVVDLVCTLPAG